MTKRARCVTNRLRAAVGPTAGRAARRPADPGPAARRTGPRHVRRAVYAAGMSDATRATPPPRRPPAATPSPPGWRPSRATCSPTTTTSPRCVAHHGLGARVPALHAAGRAVAGPLDAAARRNDLPGNHPVLEDWDGIGRYTAAVAHHPSHREAGRAIYGTGVMTAYGEVGVDGRAAGTSPRRPVAPAPQRFILVAVLPDRPGRRGRAQLPAGLRRRGDPHPAAPRHRRAAGRVPARAARPGLRHEPDRLAVPDRGAGRLGRGRQRGAWPPRSATTTAARARRGRSAARSGSAPTPTPTCSCSPPGWTSRARARRASACSSIPRLRADGTPNGFRIRRLKTKLGTRSMASGGDRLHRRPGHRARARSARASAT